MNERVRLALQERLDSLRPGRQVFGYSLTGVNNATGQAWFKVSLSSGDEDWIYVQVPSRFAIIEEGLSNPFAGVTA